MQPDPSDRSRLRRVLLVLLCAVIGAVAIEVLWPSGVLRAHLSRLLRSREVGFAMANAFLVYWILEPRREWCVALGALAVAVALLCTILVPGDGALLFKSVCEA